MSARKTLVLIMTAAVLLSALMLSPRGELSAQDQGEALGDVVSSSAEGPMEGVVVTARRTGANFDVSVVSNAQGRYRFPAAIWTLASTP